MNRNIKFKPEIRRMKKNEMKQVAMILKAESRKEPYNEKWTNTSAVKKIKEYIKDCNEIYVAVFDKEILGFIIVRREVGWNKGKLIVNELFIKEDYQRQGIGKMLVKKVERIYQSKVGAMFLTTSKDAKAYKFYQSLGFKASRRTVYMKKEV
ncbi:MAG: GNAT family N-acetyltransferase [archaeon]